MGYGFADTIQDPNYIFPSLDDLVRHYKDNNLEVSEAGWLHKTQSRNNCSYLQNLSTLISLNHKENKLAKLN